MPKKTLSVLLSVLMLFTVLPVKISAEEMLKEGETLEVELNGPYEHISEYSQNGKSDSYENDIYTIIDRNNEDSGYQIKDREITITKCKQSAEELSKKIPKIVSVSKKEEHRLKNGNDCNNIVKELSDSNEYYEYAVLQNDGDLVCLQSTESINPETTEKIKDIYGNEYSGTIIAFRWSTPYSLSEEDRNRVLTILVADKQTVDFSTFANNNDHYSNKIRAFHNLEHFYSKGFDTSKIKYMNELFAGCNRLTELDISSFDTSNVISMERMFANCSSLTKLDVSSLNTSKVISMEAMFANCSNLTELNVSSLDTSNVVTMKEMFQNCNSLTQLDLLSFNTSNTETMEAMFQGCVSLTQLDLSSFDTSKVTNMEYMFGCHHILDEEGCLSLTELDLSSFDTTNVISMEGMFSGCSSLTELDVTSFNTVRVVNMGQMFAGCYSLITLDLGSFETYNVVNMNSMFGQPWNSGLYDYGCKNLKELNISSFNTAQVEDMQNMFNGCASLTTLDVSSFDTSNVRNMGCMFYGCSNLTELDLSKFNALNVQEMNYMFEGCSSLTELDLSSFNTSKVTYMWGIFEDCTNLAYIDLSSFDTSNVYDMEGMFYNCNNLKSIDVSSFNTSKVNDMSEMFYGCFSLNKLDLSSFYTPELTYMDDMFSGCKNLKELDLSSFITDDVIYMDGLFKDCSSLIELNLPNFYTPYVYSFKEMFDGCTNLRVLDIRHFSTEPIDGKRREMDLMFGCSEDYTCSTPNLEAITLGPEFTDWTGRAYFPPGVWHNGELKKAPWELYVYYPDHASEWAGTWRKSDRVTEYHGEFYFAGIDGIKTETCDYTDDFFSGTSHIYRHKLAVMSLAVAMSAYNLYNPTTKSKYESFEDLNENDESIIKHSPAENVYELLNNCGFDSISVSYDYLRNVEYNDKYNHGQNMGVCLGKKKMDDGSTLIAIALRGGNYGDEWIGNFTLTVNNSYHTGFLWAERKAKTALTNYIADREITGHIKVWICGYSRAAITANLLAAEICRDGVNINNCYINPDDVYAYTFETPRGTKEYVHDEIYKGIWNIVNPTDIVPMVAMEDWNYNRFGTTLYLPCKYTNWVDYDAFKNKTLNFFNKYLIDNFDSIPQSSLQNYQEQALVDFFAFIFGDESNLLFQTCLNQIQYKYINNEISTELKYTIGSLIVLAMGIISSDPTKNIPKVYKALKTFESGSKFFTNVAYAHYAELTLAWMKAVPDGSYLETTPKTRYIVINCPVDIEAYTDDETLQLRIINDEVFMKEDAIIEGFIDDQGQMIICVPPDIEADLRIIGTDSGELNYSVQEYDLDSQKVEKVKNYYDIPVEEGTELFGSVSNAEEHNYLLLDENNKTIEPDVNLEGTDIAEYAIRVTSEGNGTVYGGTTAVIGEYAEVIAEPENGEEFLGWYEDDTLVSSALDYRFRVEKDLTLVGKFTGEKESLQLEKYFLTLRVGKSEKLIATVIPKDTKLIWSSADTTVATVDQNGNVTAVADNGIGTPSETVITVTTEDGNLSEECIVQVEDPINGFVRRLYKLCFNRTADPGGFNKWTSELRSKKNTAAATVKFFFTSKEFRNLQLDDEAFTEMCYQVMMDRNSDAGGKKNWLDKLNAGVSQLYVIKGFIGSREFKGICNDYGIEIGTITLTEPRDQNLGITQFVSRNYSEVLGRKADVNGLNNWCNKILSAENQKKAAIDMASTGFFHSREYLNKNASNEEYVNTLYRTFFGREADQGGYNNWMNKLNSGTSRDTVLMGFANSKEFANIMAKYGIK